MKTLKYTQTIKAPVQTVWFQMLEPETFAKWTAAFMEGSRYEGSWEEGESIRFLGPDGCGMNSIIDENREHEHISIKHLGSVKDEKPDTESEESKQWENVFEKYWFKPSEDGGTDLRVSIDCPEEYVSYFEEAWPKALQILKEISEKEAIRGVIAEWDNAILNKDAEALVKDYCEDISLYDIGGQYHGADAIKKLWEMCFPFFGNSVGVERKDIQFHISGDLAVMHGYTRLTGHPDDAPDMAKSWMRMTVCYRRENGTWKGLHEHVSFPVNCETGTITYLLDE